ncbi:MAG: hypothetical protein ACI4PL_05315 [Faecousia sp.]
MSKRLQKALRILLIAAALTGFALGGLQLYNTYYVNLDSVSYPIDAAVLDLSGRPLGDWQRLTRFSNLRQVDLRQTGITPEQYSQLRELMPDCAITWELPFQGSFYSLGTKSIQLSSLTLEEAELLDYLPQLTIVEAWDCRDYEALLALQHRRPECKVLYSVELMGQLYDCDTTELRLTDVTDVAPLAYLPRLRSVRFTGELPPSSQLLRLRRERPEMEVTWEKEVCGTRYPSDLGVLDLSGTPELTISDLDKLLGYFPELTALHLGQTQLPQEALLALERGKPGLMVVWEITVCSVPVSRDTAVLDLSGQTIPDLPALEEQFALFPNLEQVVMCGCGIPSPEMEALQNRHPDIRFVWSVNLGGISLRTDAVYFAPNKYYIEVTDEDLQELRYCRDLVCVDIGHMRGVTNCDWAVYLPKLQYLVIADTNIRDISPLSELSELVFLELFMSPIRDYSPLLECKKLEDLNLGYTYGSPDPILQMTWLKRLWWPGNLKALNWSVRNSLRQALPDAKMNFVAGSSTGEGWRAGQRYYEMRDLMEMPYMTG